MTRNTFPAFVRKTFIALLACAATSAWGETLKLLTTPFSNGANLGGGEFSAVGVSGVLDKSAYNSLSLYLGNIETFCLEYKEHFSPGTTYDYSISTKAFSGDIAGPGGDPISVGTAWLYSQFATGALAGYNYSYTNATEIAARKNSSLNLQLAFWYLEDETQFISGYGSYDPTTNPFLVAARDHFGGNFTDAKAHANGNFGVLVLNITSNNGANLHQSQVYYVPDSATTFGLLGISFVLFGVARRRRS